MEKGFLATMKDFFGLKAGQSPMQFGKECAALSHAEKLQFHAMLEAAGHPCVLPIEAKTSA